MEETKTLARRRVLLVEDDYLIAVQLVNGLRAKGVEVVGPVASVAEALAVVATAGRLDGAVLDINLRGEVAYPVADALAERGVPFLFATGYDDEVLPTRYVGVARCEKPTSPIELAEALFA